MAPKDDMTAITDPSIRRKLAVEQDRLKAAKLFDVFSDELDDALQARKRVPELLGRIDSLERTLARPQRLEATLRQPAKPKATVTRPDAVRAVGDAMVAEFLRFTSQRDPDQTLRELHPGDDGRLCRKVARDLMVKAASDPAKITHAGFGAELVRSGMGGWIRQLEAVAVFGAIMAQGGRQLPMDGINSLTYPHRSTTHLGSVAQSFVGEGASIPVKDGMLASRTFSRKKMGVITVATAELNKVAVEPLRDIMLEMITADTGQMLDGAILDPTFNGIATIRPSSPWLNAANRASVGTDLTSIIADLSWLIGQIDRPKQPLIIMDSARALRLRSWRDNMGWVFAPEMANGTILGTPFVASANVPTDQVYIIDADDFAAWTPVPEIDISQTATIAMADDDGVAPTMADTNAVNDTGGSIHISDAPTTTPATVVRSTFQTDSVALRVVQPIEWGMLREARTAYLTAVVW
ncbi:hypothetical protein [Falsiruegeria mediterranea]